MALDQCADQYVLALSPREAVAGLSMRADDPDSALAARAAGLPQRRATLESILAGRPQVVVRYWAGDPALLRAVEARGVRVAAIADAQDFDGVRANIRAVAAALGAPAKGEALIADMDARLARSAGAWKGARAVYLTPGGVTAGPGVLVDAVMRGAGLTNAASSPGFGDLPLEALALDPPKAVVLGFFDDATLAGGHWGPGRTDTVRRLLAGRTLARLPGALLSCPSWLAAQAVERLAGAAPR